MLVSPSFWQWQMPHSLCWDVPCQTNLSQRWHHTSLSLTRNLWPGERKFLPQSISSPPPPSLKKHPFPLPLPLKKSPLPLPGSIGRDSRCHCGSISPHPSLSSPNFQILWNFSSDNTIFLYLSQSQQKILNFQRAFFVTRKNLPGLKMWPTNHADNYIGDPRVSSCETAAPDGQQIVRVHNFEAAGVLRVRSLREPPGEQESVVPPPCSLLSHWTKCSCNSVLILLKICWYYWLFS